MARGAIWSLVSVFFVAASIGACAKSTDDLCDEACEIWDSCGDPNWYPYDECYDECKAEGNWSKAYLKCLQTFDDSCQSLEESCG
jgi:hypothetical protein